MYYAFMRVYYSNNTGIGPIVKGQSMYEDYNDITDRVSGAAEAGLTIKLEQDEDAENPRTDYDNVGTIWTGSRDGSSDKGAGEEFEFDFDEFSSFEAFVQGVKDALPGGTVLPVYRYSHSGTIYAVTPFDCRWDSGPVGVIYCSAEAIAENWTKYGYPDNSVECLTGEIETYSQYVSGEVYGFIIEDADGDELDSCWGHFGHEYAIEAAQDAAKSHIEDANAAKIARGDKVLVYAGALNPGFDLATL